MATLLIALPILSTTTLQAAGGQADPIHGFEASKHAKPRVGQDDLGRTGAQSEDPPADQQAQTVYWSKLAKKRLHLLGKRERRIVALLTKIHKMRASRNRDTHRPSRESRMTGSPAAIICRVFGSQCRKAVDVARCESRFNIYARNGEHWGLLQMGSYERDYGARHGAPFAWNAWAQARNAYAYWRDVGWGRWTCA